MQKKFYGQQKFTKGRLPDVAQMLGVDVSDITLDLDGSCMQDCYNNKDWAGVHTHQEDDIKLTWRLYARVRGFIPKSNGYRR